MKLKKRFIMWLIILSCLLFCLADNVWSQRNNASFGLKITSLGANLSTGYESGSVALELGMSHPFYDATKPEYYYFNAGYVYQFSEENSFNVTAKIGYGFMSKAVIRDNERKEPVRKAIFIPSLEIGKDMYQGRLFVEMGKVDRVYFGAGMRFYL